MSDLQELSTKLKLGGSASAAARAAALLSFQKTAAGGLRQSGLPNPQTLAAMAIYDPLEDAPRSFKRFLEGGKAPGTFGRDIAATMSQVPMWIWLGLGVGFYGLAYLGYRRSRSGKRRG